MLGLGAAEAPGRDALINWVRGADIDDENADGSTTDARLAMGDPMNGRPATVIYGGTVANPDPNDGVVYAVTNEGYLQAIDAADGHELLGLHAEVSCLREPAICTTTRRSRIAPTASMPTSAPSRTRSTKTA